MLYVYLIRVCFAREYMTSEQEKRDDEMTMMTVRYDCKLTLWAK